MDASAARSALELYAELRVIDTHIAAMRTSPGYAKTPLQKVTFYERTATFSGPQNYEPKHLQEAISACIVSDMAIERERIVRELRALCFDV
jgi:hypothetical protein